MKCDARPVRRQTYGYLPSRKASRLLTGTKLYSLVAEAHVCEQLAQSCYPKARGRESNPRPSESQVQRPNYAVLRVVVLGQLYVLFEPFCPVDRVLLFTVLL